MFLVERLKAARKECKMTQQQVAALLGIDRSTYAYYELGVSTPSLDNIAALASIFKTEIEWFCGADANENWNSSESELQLIKAVKEKGMAELSKEERQLVALFRMASVSEDKKTIITSLMDSVFGNKEKKE